VPQEDSLGWDDQSAWSLSPHASRFTPHGCETLTIGVADLPAISNFTDFEALSREPDVRLVRVTGPIPAALDALIFPGTKNTPAALKFVKAQGLDQLATRLVDGGGLVMGICGGYQILGKWIRDPHGVESAEREMEGIGLLDVITGFARKKVLIQVTGVHRETGCPVRGYQVHMGRTRPGAGVVPLFDVENPKSGRWPEGAVSADGRVLGTYVHGVFDAPLFRRAVLNRLRALKGWAPLDPQPDGHLDEDLDRLADFVAQHLDLALIEAIIEKGI
jgi:adenosylcobyric acid synthase